MKYIFTFFLIVIPVICFANHCPTPDEIVLTEDYHITTHVGWHDENNVEYQLQNEQYKISFLSVNGTRIGNLDKILIKECHYNIEFLKHKYVPMLITLVPEQTHFADINDPYWATDFDPITENYACDGMDYVYGPSNVLKCNFDKPY